MMSIFIPKTNTVIEITSLYEVVDILADLIIYDYNFIYTIISILLLIFLARKSIEYILFGVFSGILLIKFKNMNEYLFNFLFNLSLISTILIIGFLAISPFILTYYIIELIIDKKHKKKKEVIMENNDMYKKFLKKY